MFTQKNIVFKTLGATAVTDLIINATEEFVSHINGYKKQKNKHKVVDLHFKKTCKSNKMGRSLDSVKNVDIRSFSSCQGVLVELIKRHDQM